MKFLKGGFHLSIISAKSSAGYRLDCCNKHCKIKVTEYLFLATVSKLQHTQHSLHLHSQLTLAGTLNYSFVLQKRTTANVSSLR